MSKKIDKFKIFGWTLVLAWMIIIFWSSAIPSYPVDFTKSQYDIVSSLVHLFFYIVLVWLLIRAFVGSGINIYRALIFSFLIAIAFGAFDEWHQGFVPGREMSFSDWLLDFTGALVVVGFYKKIKKIKSPISIH